MRYYFGALAIIILLFFGVRLIFSATRRNPAPANTAVTTPANTVKLSDLANTSAEVSVRMSSGLTPDENHYEVKITVSRDERTIDIYRGYENVVVATKSYDNNSAAYEVFLKAISDYGFTKEQKSQFSDDRDVCPLGNHYYYGLSDTDDPSNEKHLWSVSCGVTLGTAGTASGPAIRGLFQQQIPDYGTLAYGTGF